MLGNQTAKSGENVDFSANTPNILSKNTNENATAIPIARLTPIPPLRFIEDTETAIIVNINAETGTLYFLYKTTKYTLIFEDPRFLSLSIKAFKSPKLNVSAMYTTGVKSSR